jgi:hypothetical protein
VEVARGFNQQAAMGEDVFAAMTRVIDRIDPSWRE